MTLYFIIFAVLACAVLLSLQYPWWRKKQDGLLVLRYTHIGRPHKKTKDKTKWISAKAFAAQMDFLARRGFNAVSLSEIADNRLPARPVAITFDCGYKDTLAAAETILKKHNFKANIFLTPLAVDKYNFWDDPENNPWEQIITREHAAGLFSAGWGGGVLPLNYNTPAQENMEYEFAEAAARLRQMFGGGFDVLALPGETDFGALAVETIKKAGARKVFVNGRKTNIFPLAFVLRRLEVLPKFTPADFYFKTTKQF